MRRPHFAALTSAAVLSLSTFALIPTANAASDTGLTHRNVPVCAAPVAGSAACDAIRRDTLDSKGKPVQTATTTLPAGYGPSDIASAYNLSAGPHRTSVATVAIVDAYDDPTAAADLAHYRTTYGLPDCGSGCFTKVNQTGGSTMPKVNGGWAQEISLDLDMVSATCPDCHILLVEANSSSFANLATAVKYAASRPGVVAISNSYGGSDSANNTAYNQPGIAVTASSGDNGYGVESPASFSSVIAVGGTSLKHASNTRGWGETAWSGAGSGCSSINAKPTWQSPVPSSVCAGKVNADVSAVADPSTGVAVYDSTSYQGHKGWMVFGGTSVASPIIASVYALGTTATGYDANGTNPAASVWGNSNALNDVMTGSNGSCGTVLCQAGGGWDGPTGLGTPNGTGAF
jgi:subtilase family serine protease